MASPSSKEWQAAVQDRPGVLVRQKLSAFTGRMLTHMGLGRPLCIAFDTAETTTFGAEDENNLRSHLLDSSDNEHRRGMVAAEVSFHPKILPNRDTNRLLEISIYLAS